MSNFQVLKLSNGDDVICNLVETKENTLKVTSPLKMDTINRVTKRGVAESLALTRWIQPYSDQQEFDIQKTSVVIMAEASVGLTRYYQYVLRTLDKMVTVEKFTPNEMSEEAFHEALELKKVLNKKNKKPLIDEEVTDNLNLEEEERLIQSLIGSKKTIH
jgi:hypothetical protein